MAVNGAEVETETFTSWLIVVTATIISLVLPLLVVFYIQNYDEVNHLFLFYNHEQNIISTYQKIVDEMERKSKKYD